MDSMDITTTTAIAIVVAAGSELIALSPLKSNSWIQLLLSAARMVFPKKPTAR